MHRPPISAYRLESLQQADELFKEIGVHPGGIRKMREKALFYILRLNDIPAAACNILKQEVLSAGGEAAVSKGVVSCEVVSSDVVLMGTLATYRQVAVKLKEQPLGGPAISRQIEGAIEALTSAPGREVVIEERRYNTFENPLIMGILNVTPDSFYDGGCCIDPDRAARHARQMEEDGADIIDIGALSTRPGSVSISEEDELSRLLPALEKVREAVNCPLSIDTFRARVAREAVDRGVTVINDITALTFDEKMSEVAADSGSTVILMHMQGSPQSMQQSPTYRAVIPEISEFLSERARFARDNGITPDRIIIDPGIGFGKRLSHNLEIMNHLDAFQSLGYPVAIGPSRKSFIGQILDLGPEERLNGTMAAVAVSVLRGVDILRVHDVKQMSEVLRVTAAISRTP